MVIIDRSVVSSTLLAAASRSLSYNDANIMITVALGIAERAMTLSLIAERSNIRLNK